MQFTRNEKERTITLDIGDAEPQQIQTNALLSKATAHQYWTMLVRVRLAHECHDVFDEGWATVSEDDTHVTLSRSVGLRARQEV